MVTDTTLTSPLGLEQNRPAISPTRRTHLHDAGVGLREKTIDYIVNVKQEPDWVRDFRMNALKMFLEQTDADALGEQGSRGDRLR